MNEKYSCFESDLWAAGGICYFMLSGLPPFHSDGEYLTFRKVEKLDFSYPEGFHEIGKELIEMKKGVILDNSNIPCLLWVDDIVTQNQKFDEIQEMLDKIYEMSKKYKLKFGDDKCKHMILSDDLEPTRFLYLGDIKLKKVESYKYLGIMMNKTCNLTEHLKYLNGKMTSAVSKISNVTSEYVLRNLRVQTIKLMIENTINPILGYGLEPYKIGSGEMTNLQNKQGRAIKVHPWTK